MAQVGKVMASFWGPGDYGVLSPLTPGMVHDAEELLGVRLPVELLRLLRVQNGGAVSERWNAFPVPGEEPIPFDHLMGIGPARA
ncbi:SMI1/KNR4 family protein [Nonomuraea sp. NPDC050663]|uniref:SMI1/KNR4 family protein n=1 Tax=Nonomuraea sp. NPDC050663 TaxID=3364370 RepID=UPI0037AFFE97